MPKQKIPESYKGFNITRQGRRIEASGCACGRRWTVGGSNMKLIRTMVDAAKACELEGAISSVLPGARRILGDS